MFISLEFFHLSADVVPSAGGQDADLLPGHLSGALGGRRRFQILHIGETLFALQIAPGIIQVLLNNKINEGNKNKSRNSFFYRRDIVFHIKRFRSLRNCSQVLNFLLLLCGCGSVPDSRMIPGI